MYFPSSVRTVIFLMHPHRFLQRIYGNDIILLDDAIKDPRSCHNCITSIHANYLIHCWLKFFHYRYKTFPFKSHIHHSHVTQSIHHLYIRYNCTTYCVCIAPTQRPTNRDAYFRPDAINERNWNQNRAITDNSDHSRSYYMTNEWSKLQLTTPHVAPPTTSSKNIPKLGFNLGN